MFDKNKALRHGPRCALHIFADALEIGFCLGNLGIAQSHFRHIGVGAENLATAQAGFGDDRHPAIFAADLTRRRKLFVQKARNALFIKLFKRKVAIVVETTLEIALHEITVALADKLSGLPHPTPQVVEARIGIFDDEVCIDEQNAYRQGMENGLELAVQLFGVILRSNQVVFTRFQNADIGDGTDKIMFVIRCRNPSEARDDWHGATIRQGYAFSLLDCPTRYQNLFVFTMKLISGSGKHLACGLADISGEIAAHKLFIGSIGKCQPTLVVAKENRNGQLFQRLTQQPGFTDMFAEKRFVRLELGDIDTQANQHAVFEPSVDNTHPSPVADLLDRFQMRQGKLAQPCIDPGAHIRLITSRSIARFHAGAITGLQRTLECQPGRQFNIKLAIEFRKPGIAIDKSIVAVVDDDPGVDQIDHPTVQQQIRSSGLAERGFRLESRHDLEHFEQIETSVVAGEALATSVITSLYTEPETGNHFLGGKYQRSAFLVFAVSTWCAIGQ